VKTKARGEREKTHWGINHKDGRTVGSVDS